MDVVSLGCRLNAYEGEAIRAQLAAQNLHDVIVVNTCAVTAEAEKQARQTIRRLRRQHPEARLVVTGCAAQVAPERFAAMAEVDHVLGNREKLEATQWRDLGKTRVSVGDIMTDAPPAAFDGTGPAESGPAVNGFPGRPRAYLEIQQGCDHRCTFCIIPYGRGNSRSVPMGAVVEQARKLTEGGYCEIVLTGVDATSYGADLPGRPSLGSLAKTLLKQVPDIRRLRLSSIDSIEADDHLWDLIADEPRFMPHLHLSLQHGDDLILKRMKRRHSSADARAFCGRVRALRPDASFGADMIAGFPTETEDMFANAARLAEDCGIAHLHVFPYSPRPGTPAARMPQLDRALVKDRASRLRETGKRLAEAHLDSMIGKREMILVENNGLAHTENFTLVDAAGLKPRDLVPVTITGHNGKHLTMRPETALSHN